MIQVIQGCSEDTHLGPKRSNFCSQNPVSVMSDTAHSMYVQYISKILPTRVEHCFTFFAHFKFERNGPKPRVQHGSRSLCSKFDRT